MMLLERGGKERGRRGENKRVEILVSEELMVKLNKDEFC